ncbi:MAG: hypothetical protein H0T65_22810, partial [Deltaproteobacteria bacterium]|nr:hypothetical protein [Deltaproteobacteria bacterium]
MKTAILLATFAFAIASGAAIADVPSKVSFTARLVNEETGDALTGAHRVKFELFDAATGGASVWLEGRQFEIEDDGLLFASLGETKALDAAVFDGRALWLEVTLDDKVMEPRIALDSVPYAIRAHAATEADKVGGKTVNDLQSRITGTCASGSFVQNVNPDGTVTCGAGATGTGDITEVLAGSGLQGGGPSGSVTLGLLQSCAVGQVLKWTGTAWTCQADAVGTGDITSVVAGPGLMGGGTTGDVTVSLLTTCGVSQVLKWNGSTWVCAMDIDTDTNSGGDITSVTTSAASGLVGGVASGDAALSLLTNCGTGQILKWTGAAWGCAADVDTDTNSGGDITDVVAGNGLSGGGASGAATLDIGGGFGIVVNANNIQLDTAATDTRYVNSTGDTMTGSLDMGNQRIFNRGCPAGYIKAGPA